MFSPSTLSLFALCMSSIVYSADWNYNWDDTEKGPFYWDTISSDFEACGGDSQSPINIYPEAADGFDAFMTELNTYSINQDGTGNTLLDAWNWQDNYIHHFQVTNNGHSIAFVPIDAYGNALNTKENDYIARLPNIFGTSDTQEFCLHSFHLHWGDYNTAGSEHTINGMEYPCEIHFVHYSCDYDSLGDALADYDNLEDQRVLAVVGFLFEVDDNASEEETQLLTEIYQSIYDLENKGDTTIVPNVNLLGNILPSYIQDGVDRSASNFWYYKGSLTTPPCTEAVQWHVMNFKPKITSLQLTILRSINGSNGKLTQNWRPVQDNLNPLYSFEFATSGDNSDNSDNSLNTDTSEVASQNAVDNIQKDIDDLTDASNETENMIIVILIVIIVFFILWVAKLFYDKHHGSSDDGSGKHRPVTTDGGYSSPRGTHKPLKSRSLEHESGHESESNNIVSK